MGYGLTISTTKYKASSDNDESYAISNDTDDGYGVADVVTNWILRDGTWRDLGIWIDNEIWKDG